jgi:hypothetical protein
MSPGSSLVYGLIWNQYKFRYNVWRIIILLIFVSLINSPMETTKTQLKHIWGAMGIIYVIGVILWLTIGDIKDLSGIIALSIACILYGTITSMITITKGIKE